MMFVLVVGLFCIFAPSWIICAAGLGSLDEDDAALWVVRVLGVLVTGLAVYLMFLRH